MQMVRRNRDINPISNFDNFIDEFFRSPHLIDWEGLTSTRNTVADVYETANEVVLKMPVPGVSPEDINIQITGDTVTISGETKDDQELQERNFFQRQLRYGRFAQSVMLPTLVQSDKADASVNNGILTLTLPKSEEAKPKQIKVHVQEKGNSKLKLDN